MKRGGFWITTVATGVAVVGLMTAGRAGLRSQAVLFLQGQMKIAAGDTDTGLRLLAEASSRPQTRESATNSLQTASEPRKTESKKPCRDWTKSTLNSSAERKVSRAGQKLNVKSAPEPTLASLEAPVVPAPPMLHSPYAQDAIAYIPTVQREQLRAQQAEVERARRIRELELKQAMRQISFKYDLNVPSAREIQVQVERGLQTLAQ
jgi:hypothetical protein